MEKKKAAIYLRVSTKKEEQLESLANQQEYFKQYFEQNPAYELTHTYVDEGISGKSIKHRKEFIRMLSDAKTGAFDVIFTKDISRFSRNMIDCLTSIEELKDSKIPVKFLNNNMESVGGDGLTIAIMAFLAEQEIANMSVRMKLAKNMSAKEGRVPNSLYGYDRKDKYTLIPNESEARWVKTIFNLYVQEQLGGAKIAEYLNSLGVPTPRGIKGGWSQNVVSRILKNKTYVGKVVNRQSETISYKTGKRKTNPPEEHIVVERPEFRIIEDELFEQAQKLLSKRQNMFKTNGKRHSTKYALSNLLTCANDNYSFRRNTRRYSTEGKLYVWWTCSYRNSRGATSCDNNIRLDEDQMHQAILAFLDSLLEEKDKLCSNITKKIQAELEKRYRQDETLYNRKQLDQELKQLGNRRNRLLDLYADGLFDKDELETKVKKINSQIKEIEKQIKVNSSKEIAVQDIRAKVINYIDKLETTPEVLNNVFLKSIFEKFIVHDDGRIEAVLKIGDIGESLVIPFVTVIDTSKQTDSFGYNSAQRRIREAAPDK